MSTNNIQTIGILGAGTMGQGIAEVCISAGFKVLLYDIQPGLLSASILSITKNLNTKVAKGKITLSEKGKALGLITPVNDLQELHADIVIEAVIEKLDVKQSIFSALETIVSRDCILATNTSSIPIAQIASALKHADRFAGLHFFNPAPVMKLVEVIKGKTTSDSTIQILADFSQKLLKQPVFAQDSPGFIVNRVARHYYVESLKIVEDNVADVSTIDELLRSTGFKMGPFELMDLIGIDVNLSVTTTMYHALNQEIRFTPSKIQQQMVAAGNLGRKTGKGFYDYGNK